MSFLKAVKSSMYGPAVILLLFSFAVHSIQFNHLHPEDLFGHESHSEKSHGGQKERSESVQALLHGEDRKLWMAVLLLEILLSAGILNLFARKEAFPAGFRAFPFPDISKFFSPVHQALKRGIIHPKLCA